MGQEGESLRPKQMEEGRRNEASSPMGIKDGFSPLRRGRQEAKGKVRVMLENDGLGAAERNKKEEEEEDHKETSRLARQQSRGLNEEEEEEEETEVKEEEEEETEVPQSDDEEEDEEEEAGIGSKKKGDPCLLQAADVAEISQEEEEEEKEGREEADFSRGSPAVHAMLIGKPEEEPLPPSPSPNRRRGRLLQRSVSELEPRMLPQSLRSRGRRRGDGNITVYSSSHFSFSASSVADYGADLLHAEAARSLQQIDDFGKGKKKDRPSNGDRLATPPLSALSDEDMESSF